MAMNIFVGYSASDFSFSEALMTALAATGAQVWHEHKEQSSEETTALLSECQVFLLVLSKGALLSPPLRNHALEYATLHNFHPENRCIVVQLEPLAVRDLWLFIRHNPQITRNDEADAVFITRIVQEVGVVADQAPVDAADAVAPGITNLNSAATGKRRGKNQWRPIFAVTALALVFAAVVAIAGWQLLLAPHPSLASASPTTASSASASFGHTSVLTPPITPTPRAISTSHVEATATTRAAPTATPLATATPRSQAASNAPSVTATPAPTIDFSHGFNNANNLQMNGGAARNGTALQLTDNNYWEARSSFYTTPVSVTAFTCQFTFQSPNLTSSADGFTFVIQNNDPGVVGAPGGDLGYTGVGNSIAIKFDLYSTHFGTPDNQVSTTGLFTNGAAPDQPEIALPTGVNLHSGDAFAVTLTYSAGTLATTITDTNTNASFAQKYAVDIPGTVGNNMAYVGFTGATGGLYATQSILSWSYNAQ